jgi:hypothetical protein
MRLKKKYIYKKELDLTKVNYTKIHDLDRETKISVYKTNQNRL